MEALKNLNGDEITTFIKKCNDAFGLRIRLCEGDSWYYKFDLDKDTLQEMMSDLILNIIHDKPTAFFGLAPLPDE